MAIDGIILHAICNELQAYMPCKINKIQQVSDTEILFTIRSNNQNHKLMISTHSNYNRMHITTRSHNLPDTPSAFLMVLRKYINGAIIKEMRQEGLDRVVIFTIETRDDLGDIQTIYMYVELMGKYANVILVNEDKKVIDALKRIPPFENSVRTIHPGAVFVEIQPHTNKVDPFITSSVDQNMSLSKQCHGFSPLLSNEVLFRLQNGQTFREIMEEIQTSHTVYYYELDGKDFFHILALTHLRAKEKTYRLQNALDVMYHEKEEKVRIKEQSGDLLKIARLELKKCQNKLVKLQQTLEDAYNLETYRTYGDLLYAYAYQYPKKYKFIEVASFEGDSVIQIVLDEKLDIKQNAKKYYQKYTKSKTAQIEVAKQIALTQEQQTYFETLIMQLEQASVSDALEIREELTQLRFIKRRKQINQRKKKKSIPNFIHLDIDGVSVYVGKNNIQNDYITFKQSRKHYLWLHTKDIHGSHVVIAQEEVNEKVLRIAAMFAAYYSNGRMSSSVPVNYCPIKNLRKPNNAALGFVTLTNYKTIYIDPDKESIESYLQLYEKK